VSLDPADAVNEAVCRKLDHWSTFMRWAKRMRDEGRMPREVEDAMEAYFSGNDDVAIEEAKEKAKDP
jgi:hypothetical protein